MIIRAEFRSKESKAAKEVEMAPVEHFRERIGIIKDGLVGMLVKKWDTNMKM